MPGAPEQHCTPTFLRSISLAPVSQLAVINVSLNNTPGANIRSHDFILDSLTRWDQSRERSGEGQWDFTFHVSRPGESTDFFARSWLIFMEILFGSQTKGRVRFRPLVHSVMKSNPSFKTSKMSASRPLL